MLTAGEAVNVGVVAGTDTPAMHAAARFLKRRVSPAEPSVAHQRVEAETATQICGSCGVARRVPSGVGHANEAAKLARERAAGLSKS